jgi:hypothetical protein
MHILALGMNLVVRRHLKQGPAERDGTSAHQLDMWSPRHRALVKEIDRAAVYVPSREEFVPLVPDDISPIETSEAGQYLVEFGEDCVRAGTQLLRLARLGW